MKDRIKLIMESQHMTQQIFAQFIKISPATLSGVFNGRTNPSLNIVEAIKQSLPAISTDWLLFGRGPMYIDSPSPDSAAVNVGGEVSEPVLDFDNFSSTPPQSGGNNSGVQDVRNPGVLESGLRRHDSGVGRSESVVRGQGGVFSPNNSSNIFLKNLDKKQRQITEIRIFFDDQTWETFVPKK